MFEELGRTIRDEVVNILFHAQITVEDAEELQLAQEAQSVNGGLSYEHQSLAGAQAIAAAGAADGAALGEPVPVPAQRIVSEEQKLGRNDPCWCGSGKKYKKCHGA
jgi:preprotein translocase subunit SecA